MTLIDLGLDFFACPGPLDMELMVNDMTRLLSGSEESEILDGWCGGSKSLDKQESLKKNSSEDLAIIHQQIPGRDVHDGLWAMDNDLKPQG